jgi:hypothetical protein
MCVAPKAQRSKQPGAAPQEAVGAKAPALKVRFILFQEEYRELLHRHGVELDERYVWD